MISNITFILTEACNMRCKYCFEQSGEYNSKYMKQNIFEHSLNLLLNQEEDDLGIQLFGGEPTLNNDCILKAIEMLSKTKKNVVLDMTTNLFSINKETFNKLDKLASKENIEVIIGVSAILNKKFHDEDRVDINKKGTYDKIINNLEYCLDNFKNIKFKVHSVISRKNMKHISEILDSSFDFKLKHPELIKNSFALVSGDSLNSTEDKYTKEELRYYYEDYISRDKEQYGLCKRYIEELYFPIIYSFDLLHNRDITVCRAFKSEITVGVDGNMSPCHRADMGIKNTYVAPISYGNIMSMNSMNDVEKNIPKIENIKDENVKFISELNNEDCAKCNFNSMCHTCVVANYNLTGSFKYKTKGECLRTMTMAELNLEYERIKMMKEIKQELSFINDKLNNLGEITAINSEALIELLKQK